MRRKDREMPEEFAWEVADKCEWAVLGMTDQEGGPYCVPVTIAREGKTVYFHSARAGRKVDCLRGDPRVCVTCVGDTQRARDEFTTTFQSAVMFGRAREVEDREEKVHALRLICQRHTPENMGNFDGAIEKSLGATAVWRVDVEEITGKCKK